jgi:hypothetical protein
MRLLAFEILLKSTNIQGFVDLTVASYTGSHVELTLV